MTKISPRLQKIVDSLPIRPDSRILEIGCGPGVAARAVAQVLKTGKILAIDRSAKAIAQAKKASQGEIKSGNLEFRISAIEDFKLNPKEEKYDFAFAVRVGALDGRHPEIEKAALASIKAALKPKGKIFIDGRER